MAKEQIEVKKSGATIFFAITTILLLIALVLLAVSTAIKSQNTSELEYSNENLRKDNINLRSQNELLQAQTTSQQPATPQDAQILAEYFFLFNDMMQLGTQTGIQIILIDNELILLEKTNTTDFTQADLLFTQLSTDMNKYKTATQAYLDFFNKNEQTLLNYDKQNIIKESRTIAEQDLPNIDNLVQSVQTRIQDLKKQLGVSP